jgi:hypothetical protein
MSAGFPKHKGAPPGCMVLSIPNQCINTMRAI